MLEIASRIFVLSYTTFFYPKALYAVYLSGWVKGRKGGKGKLYKKEKKRCGQEFTDRKEPNTV